MFVKVISILYIIFISFNCQSKPFTMGGDFDPPLKWLDENGNAVGIEVDLLSAIYERMPDLVPEFQFIIYKSSPRSKRELRDGTLDQYITMSRKTKRLEYLLYPTQSHLNIKWVFFTTHAFIEKQKRMGKPVVFNSYDDLTQYRIGATQDYAYSKEFWELIKNNKLNVEVIPKNKLNVKKMLAGRIDLFPSYQFKMQWIAHNEGYGHLITYLPKPIRDKKYYHPFSKVSSYPNVSNGTILKRYDEILKKLKKEGFMLKTLKKYGVN